jgi:hypothetical protein
VKILDPLAAGGRAEKGGGDGRVQNQSVPAIQDMTFSAQLFPVRFNCIRAPNALAFFRAIVY